MNTWTPLWSKVVDSSIWLEDKNTRILFVTMLALKDRDHVVRYSAFELARKANLTELEVIESLKILQKPDTKRVEPQEFEGRRIEKVEDGWFMLNGEKYRKAMQKLYRREYKRGKQAEYRQKEPDDSEPEAAEEPLEIPNSLKTERFCKLWDEWLLHLREKRKTPGPTAVRKQLNKLEKMGFERAILALENSMAGNYQGIFEPNEGRQNGQPASKKFTPPNPYGVTVEVPSI